MNYLNIFIFNALLCVVTFSVNAQDTVDINLVGNLSITGLPIHDVWGYTDSLTGSRYALLGASNSGLRVIDVSTPSDPLLVGSISGSGVQAIDIKTWGNYAYVVAESTSLSGKIIDLSDPTDPTLVGTFPGGHNLSITENGYLYLASPGLRIFDLNIDPLSPELVYTDSNCNGHDISIIGQTLYDFSDNCGTRIFDITQADSPTLLGTVPSSGIFHHSGWPSENGQYLFIGDELASPVEDDITVWDISDLSNISMVDSYTDPNAYVHNIYVHGNYALVSYYRAGFRVFNVSDPLNITLAAEYDTDPNLSGPGYGGNFGLYTFWGNDMILASDEENGLFIFSLTGLSTGLGDVENNQIQDLTLYPNPSQGISSFEYSLDAKSEIEIGIYDLHDRFIEKYVQGVQEVGQHNVELNTTGFVPGIYIVKISTDRIEKMIKLSVE